jgi:hypothetical protein
MKGKKTGGRKAGTPNKKSQEMRELILGLSDKYLASDLETLEPRERALIIARLLAYVIPRPATEVIEPSYPVEPLVIIKTEYRDKPNNNTLLG